MQRRQHCKEWNSQRTTAVSLKKLQLLFHSKKVGKQIDGYFVTKALQLYLEGLSYREIERIIGISHATISS